MTVNHVVYSRQICSLQQSDDFLRWSRSLTLTLMPFAFLLILHRPNPNTNTKTLTMHIHYITLLIKTPTKLVRT